MPLYTTVICVMELVLFVVAGYLSPAPRDRIALAGLALLGLVECLR